ncbi:calcium-binding protein, partial [Pseudomaricurvus sp.]|uniref:calcium-binding protein n=1 Tax=Pseudomaricurvus sp. TaxID=2004510 RepID=UPI003F6DA459
MQTTDEDSSTAGNDTIEAGDGFNRILGGLGQDVITAGRDEDHVISDNGEMLYLDRTLLRATSTEIGLGDSDQVDVGDGDAVVILGDGDDVLQGGDGHKIVLTDNGEVLQTPEGLLIQVRSLALAEGGDDQVALTAGDNTVIAGAGNDRIETGAGRDQIIADNGQIDYDSQGMTALMRTTDVASSTAGDDHISAGDGENRIMAGLGDDTVRSGNGEAHVIADNGELEYLNDVLVRASSRQPSLGGDDQVALGNGKAEVITGQGDDQIETGDGTKQIMTDNGELLWRPDGTRQSARTTQPEIGGNDSVDAAGGDNTILAGKGADTIRTGAGEDDVIADNGRIDYDSNGDLAVMQTTDADDRNAGNDDIATGAGNDRIMAGFGDDEINSGADDDLVMADHGRITYRNNQFLEAITQRPPQGGNDRVLLGEGNDRVFGGGGNDYLDGESGDDIIFGDFGVMGFDGLSHFYVDTSDLAQGGDDHLIGGDDYDWLLGGAGSDEFTGLFLNDILLGNYGRITEVPETDGVVVSTVPDRLGLIGGTQRELYYSAINMQDGDLLGSTVLITALDPEQKTEPDTALTLMPVTSSSGQVSQLSDSQLQEFLDNLPVNNDEESEPEECKAEADSEEAAEECQPAQDAQDPAPVENDEPVDALQGQQKQDELNQADSDMMSATAVSAAMLAAVKRRGWGYKERDGVQSLQEEWKQRRRSSLEESRFLNWTTKTSDSPEGDELH